jgi:hypothetical protein
MRKMKNKSFFGGGPLDPESWKSVGDQNFKFLLSTAELIKTSFAHRKLAFNGSPKFLTFIFSPKHNNNTY